MEHVGLDHGVVHASAHAKAYHHSIGTQKTATTSMPDVSEAFHVHSVEWHVTHVRVHQLAR